MGHVEDLSEVPDVLRVSFDHQKLYGVAREAIATPTEIEGTREVVHSCMLISRTRHWDIGSMGLLGSENSVCEVDTDEELGTDLESIVVSTRASGCREACDTNAVLPFLLLHPSAISRPCRLGLFSPVFVGSMIFLGALKLLPECLDSVTLAVPISFIESSNRIRQIKLYFPNRSIDRVMSPDVCQLGIAHDTSKVCAFVGIR